MFAPPVAWSKDDWEQARWEGEALLRQGKARTWRPREVFDCLLWPLLLFGYVYYWSFGSWRFYSWKLAATFGAVLAVALCVHMTWATVLLFRRRVPCRKAMALTGCLWLASIVGMWAGDQSYGHYMIGYYTYQDLVSYTDVDPAHAKGQSYMDAGEVYFKEGTEVATNEMVSFTSRTNFCAAPIIGQPLRNQAGPDEVAAEGGVVIPEAGSIDFWAVGTNCCDKASRTFTCGQVSDRRARAGMRMIREDHRPFYLLAVQEWTARMCPTTGEDNAASGHAKAAPLVCLPARHPLLFTWVEDPVGEVTKYYEQAIWHFKLDAILFFAANTFFAFGALWALQYMGFK